jgi:hypothetical protein
VRRLELAFRRDVSGVTSTVRDSSLASFPDSNRLTTFHPLRASALLSPVTDLAREGRVILRDPVGAATAEARVPEAPEESSTLLVRFLPFPEGRTSLTDVTDAVVTGGGGATYPGVPGPVVEFQTPNPE